MLHGELSAKCKSMVYTTLFWIVVRDFLPSTEVYKAVMSHEVMHSPG